MQTFLTADLFVLELAVLSFSKRVGISLDEYRGPHPTALLKPHLVGNPAAVYTAPTHLLLLGEFPLAFWVMKKQKALDFITLEH